MLIKSVLRHPWHSFIRTGTRRLTSSIQSSKGWRPGLTTLAIESSCDDSSVAVLSIEEGENASSKGQALYAKVKYHKTVTANTHAYQGIHPLVALDSHETHVHELVRSAIPYLGDAGKPTFISVTRGPGMRSNLAVGLNIAKGLSIAWDVPLVGVHHMQAHALTPRLCWAMQNRINTLGAKRFQDAIQPQFPYLTALVSGGHTMLLQSNGLLNHNLLAETMDIALGVCLDKSARLILPAELLKPPYGRALEQFAYPDGAEDYNYTAPVNRQAELEVRSSRWEWSLRPPLSNNNNPGHGAKSMTFAFNGLPSTIERIIKHDPAGSRHTSTRDPSTVSIDERRDLAKELMRVAFEHFASRILLHLQQKRVHVKTIVVSGGVASNMFLRHVLRKFLDVRGFEHVEIIFPPIELCTDNALMIAWAGMEMFTAGHTSGLAINPLNKWSMDPHAEDGGILLKQHKGRSFIPLVD